MDASDMKAVIKQLSTPESRRRFDALREMIISIGKRNGWIDDKMTREQALKVTFSRIGRGENWRTEQSTAMEMSQVDPLCATIKEIRVRVPWDEWQRIGEEAHRFRTTHTSLAHMWILEGLNKARAQHGQDSDVGI